MAKVVGKIMAPNGVYIKEGEEKTSWLRCGVLLETDKGFRIKLDCLPVGIAPGEGWFSVFPDEDRPAAAAPKPASGQDDMPF